MGTEAESAELLGRWRDGDQAAADELFHRYVAQLLALARGHLSAKLAPRFDPEDVVQSAYRSFFAGAREDRYVLERSGDLWRLLAAITLHKLHHQVRRHTAGRRSVDRERRPAGDPGLDFEYEAMARGPSPSEAVAVVDELERVLEPLKPHHRRMVELRLQGHLIDEIAAETGRSERLVRRVLDQVKRELSQRRHDGSAA
jgi:RNA polymerase sigma-70 factor (ECF subfamily)